MEKPLSIALGLEPHRLIEMKEGVPDPSAVGRGIVFIRALWSGQSKVSLMNLVAAMLAGLDSSWKLVILNTDNVDWSEFVKVYGPFCPGGVGEAFWIDGGQVLYSDCGYYQPTQLNCLWERTRRFSKEQLIELPIYSDTDTCEEYALKICHHLKPSQIRIVEDELKGLDDIKAGVVTVYSTSMPCILTLSMLASHLACPEMSAMKLMLLSQSLSEPDAIEIFGEFLRPARTYWVRYGNIVFRDDGFYMPQHLAILDQRIQAFKHMAD